MEIRLSTLDVFFDKRIEAAAEQASCFARIKWCRADGCRFTLVDRPMSYKAATFEQHDQVIRLLLEHDPNAVVRTAIATYNGLADYQKQKVA